MLDVIGRPSLWATDSWGVWLFVAAAFLAAVAYPTHRRPPK